MTDERRNGFQECLEMEIERYFGEHFGEPRDGCNPVGSLELGSMAEHFARWGAENADVFGYVPDDAEVAAAEYATCGCSPLEDEHERQREFDLSKEGFLAGSEWQRRQGVSWDDELGWYDGVLLYGDDERPHLTGCGFSVGDKVTVQIRKRDR